MWDLKEVLVAEQDFLDEGIESFHEYYSIPEGWTFDNPQRYVEHCEVYVNPTIGPYIHNQVRLFVNKQQVLNNIKENNGFTRIN